MLERHEILERCGAIALFLDVQNVRVIAFAIASGRSRRITESQVLPGWKISVL